jgi:hypothetical protein
MEERRIALPFVKPASLIISTISKPDLFNGSLANNFVAKSLASLFLCVPGMFGSLEVKVLYPYRRRRRVSEAQGRRCEAGSEGSVEQSRDSTNRNQI